MSDVAVIGLGTMGAPMARNLLRAGKSVVVHNRTRAREEALAEEGALRAESPAAAAQDAEVILLCVSDSPDVVEIVLDEERGVITSVGPGSLVIDCSTISPQVSRDLAEQLREKDVGFVDAPVSGGSEGAVKGTLAIMCGGSAEDFARARPILECVGKSITHVGPVGCGQIAKAVNQVVISGTYQSVAEGMVLAARAGADPRQVLAAIENGAAGSWILSHRAGNMLDDAYPLGFRMRLHRKDLGIALDSARRAGVSLPVASYVATVEDGLIRQGHGDEDLSAIARAVRRGSGVPEGAMEGDR
jgi:3-hydroxyisobutyrate dehydrogenase